MKFLVAGENDAKTIVFGDKFTITNESHLVITVDDEVVALFAAGRWNSVQKHEG